MSVNILMKVEGGEELRRRLLKFQKQMIDAMERELPAEGRKLEAASNALAPRASGELKASSSVTDHVNAKRTKVRVAVAYLLERAAAVHEGVHWGQKVKGTRGFKWMERATNAWKPEAVSRIVEALRRVVR
jgi:hypothetical protein